MAGEPATPTNAGSSDREIPWLLVLCGFYLVIETIYVSRLPLVMDEFAGAREIFRLTQGIPYRDFTPYKTILGYYIQLPALLLPGDLWSRMILVKIEMALLNTIFLYLIATRLFRSFPRQSVIAAVGLLVVMSTFLERSSELRVDMLTAWLGLFSLVLLIEKRIVLSAVACAISFFISQKGIYFCAAGTLALLFRVLVTRDRSDLRSLVKFVVTGAALGLVYLLAFTIPSSAGAVVDSIVVSPKRIALEPLYEIRDFWFQTLRRNPLFYLLAIIGAVAPVFRYGIREHVTLISPYALGFFAMCLWHKQPWPYFFVIPISVAFICCVTALEPMIEWWRRLDSPTARTLVVTLAIATGVVLPLSRLDDNLRRSNDYQAQMVRLGDAMLGPGDAYLAGFPLIYDREQFPGQLSWIDGVRIASLLDASNRENTRELAKAILDDPPRFVLRNYRIAHLPPPLQEAIATRFRQLWGNVYTYSPVLEENVIVVHHEGRYLVRGSPASSLTIGPFNLRPGDTSYLREGVYRASATGNATLLLFPEGTELYLRPEHRKERIFFPSVYEY